MPYDRFLRPPRPSATTSTSWRGRFQASFEQSATASPPCAAPAEGSPSTPAPRYRRNISKSFSASASASHASPAPAPAGTPTPPSSRRPDPHPDQRDAGMAGKYFCIARTLAEGYGRLPRQHAMQPWAWLRDGSRQGTHLRRWASPGPAAVPIGVTCRLCERTDCEQRALPTHGSSLQGRGESARTSFYAQIEET